MGRQLNVHGWEIREQLLYGKEATPLAPWLPTHEPLPAQARTARRARRPGRCRCWRPS